MTFLCREKSWKHYFKVHTMLKSGKKHGGDDLSHEILHSGNLYHGTTLVANVTREESCPDLGHFTRVHCKPKLSVVEQGLAGCCSLDESGTLCLKHSQTCITVVVSQAENDS